MEWLYKLHQSSQNLRKKCSCFGLDVERHEKMHVQCPLQIQFSSVALLTFAMECNFKHGLMFYNTDFTSLMPTDINFVIIRDETL